MLPSASHIQIKVKFLAKLLVSMMKPLHDAQSTVHEAISVHRVLSFRVDFIKHLYTCKHSQCYRISTKNTFYIIFTSYGICIILYNFEIAL